MLKITNRRDPFESPIVATVFFGSVFFIAFMVNLIKALLGRRPVPSEFDTGPGFTTITFGLFAFAVGSGVSAAIARRIMTAKSMKKKNLVTGCIVGMWYTIACWIISGDPSMGSKQENLGFLALAAFVFFAVTYVITSGLNNVLPTQKNY